jgi:hypothetical protein
VDGSVLGFGSVLGIDELLTVVWVVLWLLNLPLSSFISSEFVQIRFVDASKFVYVKMV